MSRAGAPPSTLEKGPTKGIEPPQPMYTVERPKPLARASEAALKTWLSTEVVQAGLADSLANFTLTPQGACLSRCALRRLIESFGSMSGTMRRPTWHQADSLMILAQSLREEA